MPNAVPWLQIQHGARFLVDECSVKGNLSKHIINIIKEKQDRVIRNDLRGSREDLNIHLCN